MSLFDRIAADQDWRDGHDMFRLRVTEELKEIRRQLKELKDGSNNTTRQETKL
tara:strand:+ start:1099 stop:1257 length:159 start_codon:yes stop_codon:yes gene_type:complete